MWSKKVVFEQRSANKGISHRNILKKTIPGKGNSLYKGTKS